MRTFKIIGVIFGTLLVLLLSARFLIHGNWNKMFAMLNDAGSLRAVVHGDTDNPLNGWTTHLIWNRIDDKWFVFYLNHEAFFERYELKRRDENIEVYCNGILIGQLDTAAAKFYHKRQNLLYEKPLDVIHARNMEDREKWSRWEEKDWFSP